MSSFEDYLTDESFVEAFRATYDGRHDPVDALYWLDHPAEPGPSGADAPAAGLAELKRAAYSRHADGVAEQALRALERELATDRDETLAAIVRARNPRPVLAPVDAGVEDAAPADTPHRRRWPIVVAGVAALAVALFGVQLATSRVDTQSAPTAPAATSVVPTATSVVPTASASAETPTAQTPTADPVVSYSGPASCANLVDVSTYFLYGGKAYRDIGEQVAEMSTGDAESPVSAFVESGGLVCAWTDSEPGDQAQSLMALYAYGPIDDSAARAQQQALKAEGYDAAVQSPGVRYTGDGGTYAFGDGFWVFSMPGTADVIDQLVAHAPEMADEPRTDLQSAVYVTSEGLGDLRIGQSIPSSSKLAAWNPTACNAHRGAWLARSPFAVRSDGYGTVYGLVTDDGARNGKLDRIMIYSPAIPTKSGIRVGDSEAKLKATFDEFADGGPYVLTGDVGKIAFELSSYDPEHPEAQVVVAIWVVPKGDELPSWGTDANGPCPA